MATTNHKQALARLDAAAEAVIASIKVGSWSGNPYMKPEFRELIQAVSFARTGQDGDGYDILGKTTEQTPAESESEIGDYDGGDDHQERRTITL